MRSRASFRSVLALSLLAVPGCTTTDESTVELPPPPRPADELEQAAERTLAAGPARITATVRAGRIRYRVRGRWDPTRGYRLCGRIDEAPNAYTRGRILWLEGVDRAYGTLTADGACRRRAFWIDDHPPTLELPGRRRTGAEDYLHAALLALGALPDGAMVDFRAMDREPARRDEDGWTLRPLLRALGTRGVDVRVGASGFVERVRLDAPGPVIVKLALADFGAEPRVPRVVRAAME